MGLVASSTPLQTVHSSQLQTSPVLSISPTYLLYYLPLIVTISLVFGGTRHEDTTKVIQHAWQTGRWITGFMLIIFAVLCLMAWLI